MDINIVMDIIVGCLIATVIVIGIIINASRSKDAKRAKSARVDTLTGIPGKAGEEDVIRLIDRNVVGMFLIIDIDDFKSINDSFGHEVGDKVLIALAKCMVDVFRSSDIILRIEADEFAVYCPRVTSKDIAASILDRFLDSVNKIKIPEMRTTPTHISIGASFYGGQEEIHYGDLFDTAFERCEKSKESIGNTYTLCD